MASQFQSAVATALAEQPWWQRRKDSLVAVAGIVLQLANVLAAMSADFPSWVNAVVAVVIGVAQIAIHAGTAGAITPSMARRLEVAAEHEAGDRPPLSGVVEYRETAPVEAVVVGEAANANTGV